jgi:hypothetical protein
MGFNDGCANVVTKGAVNTERYATPADYHGKADEHVGLRCEVEFTNRPLASKCPILVRR